jgi:hypothetical protein
VGGGVQTGSTRHRGHLLSYCTCPEWLWRWRIFRWNEDWQGKPKYSEKTCPSATLSTTNPTWPDPGLNPGRRGGKPATNRLSYGAAIYGLQTCRSVRIAKLLVPLPMFPSKFLITAQTNKIVLLLQHKAMDIAFRWIVYIMPSTFFLSSEECPDFVW